MKITDSLEELRKSITCLDSGVNIETKAICFSLIEVAKALHRIAIAIETG